MPHNNKSLTLCIYVCISVCLILILGLPFVYLSLSRIYLRDYDDTVTDNDVYTARTAQLDRGEFPKARLR